MATLHSVTLANIRAEMARRRIRQADIAEALGLTGGAISQKLTGTRPLTITELEAIAEKLGVPMTVLVADDHPSARGEAVTA